MNRTAALLLSGLSAALAASPAANGAEAADDDGAGPLPAPPGFRLVWADEFDKDGPPDPASWTFEHGFERNHEAQWYQEANAFCENGRLVIEARREEVRNPGFDPGATGGNAWKRTRETASYTSASVTTRHLREFQYGRLEVRAKIPVAGGAWPAIWTLGTEMEWPSCGEIDIMEYYRIRGEPHLLANFCWGTGERWKGAWASSHHPFARFLETDPGWADKFHLWRMDWDEGRIVISLDGETLNEIALDRTANGSLGGFKSPFRQPHYLLLNLALGGDCGGPIDDDAFPMRYEIDYVRLYAPAAP